MKDLFVTLAGLSVLGSAATDVPVNTWEHLLEKWGIGFVGMALFVLLARWTMNREERLQKERDARTQEEVEARKLLADELNSTQKEMLKQMTSNAKRMEYLVRLSHLSNDHHASSLRMLVRTLQSRPCMAKVTSDEMEAHIEELKQKNTALAGSWRNQKQGYE
jgi:hypothetical protein